MEVAYILQELTGRNKKEVTEILEKHGYKINENLNPRKKYNDDECFLELYNQGLYDVEIARTIGCSEGTVCNWRQENHLINNYKKSRIGATKRQLKNK